MKIAIKVILKMIFRYIIGIAGIIFLIAFLAPSIATWNFHIGTWTGVILSILMIIYGFWGWLIAFIKDALKQFLGFRIFFGMIGAAATAILVLAIMCMICMGSAMGKSPADNSTLIVLGCRVNTNGPSRMLKERLDAAYDYLQENPDSVAILCGGQGDNEPVTESEVMYEYLIGRGISADRLYQENTSTDTFENLTNASEILAQNNLPSATTIVTNDYHMYRALKYAERLGYTEPGACVAKTYWGYFLPNYIREMYGILEMWFLNR